VLEAFRVNGDIFYAKTVQEDGSGKAGSTAANDQGVEASECGHG